LSSRDVSKKAKISEATISHALAGKYLDPKTVRALAKTLAGIPVLEAVGQLLDAS
jgi:hypothetical protein